MVGIYGEDGNLAYDRIGNVGVIRITEYKNENIYGYGAPGLVNLPHKWTKE